MPVLVVSLKLLSAVMTALCLGFAVLWFAAMTSGVRRSCRLRREEQLARKASRERPVRRHRYSLRGDGLLTTGEAKLSPVAQLGAGLAPGGLDAQSFVVHNPLATRIRQLRVTGFRQEPSDSAGTTGTVSGHGTVLVPVFEVPHLVVGDYDQDRISAAHPEPELEHASVGFDVAPSPAGSRLSGDVDDGGFSMANPLHTGSTSMETGVDSPPGWPALPHASVSVADARVTALDSYNLNSSRLRLPHAPPTTRTGTPSTNDSDCDSGSDSSTVEDVSSTTMQWR